MGKMCAVMLMAILMAVMVHHAQGAGNGGVCRPDSWNHCDPYAPPH